MVSWPVGVGRVCMQGSCASGHLDRALQVLSTQAVTSLRADRGVTRGSRDAPEWCNRGHALGRLETGEGSTDPRSPLQPVLLQLPGERVPMDAENLCGPTHVAVDAHEHAADVIGLHL